MNEEFLCSPTGYRLSFRARLENPAKTQRLAAEATRFDAFVDRRPGEGSRGTIVNEISLANRAKSRPRQNFGDAARLAICFGISSRIARARATTRDRESSLRRSPRSPLLRYSLRREIRFSSSYILTLFLRSCIFHFIFNSILILEDPRESLVLLNKIRGFTS